jgi:hypothetical protein
MAHTACLVCLVSTFSGCYRNVLGGASDSSGHITKLEQSTFLRYLLVELNLLSLTTLGDTIP